MSSTDQCHSSGQHLFSTDQCKRHQFFHSKKLRCLPSDFSRIGISYMVQPLWSLFDELILGVCLLHPVFLSDILTHVIGVTNNCSADIALSNWQSNFV